jgi:predicted DNA-binding protein
MELGKKKNITIKLYQVTINRIENIAVITGLKKNTIIEQGIEKRLRELEGDNKLQ